MLKEGLGEGESVEKKRLLMSRGQRAGAKTVVPVLSVGLGERFWYPAAIVVEVEPTSPS